MKIIMGKTLTDFMRELGSKRFKLDYPDGYVEVYNNNSKMYAEGKNNRLNIMARFAFKDQDDLQEKCEDILEFEIRFCEYCGCPMNKGYTDDDADFYNCEECFPKDMNERYGKGNWRTYDNDGDCNYMGGYYEYYRDGKWQAEPSYYTEWF